VLSKAIKIALEIKPVSANEIGDIAAHLEMALQEQSESVDERLFEHLRESAAHAQPPPAPDQIAELARFCHIEHTSTALNSRGDAENAESNLPVFTPRSPRLRGRNPNYLRAISNVAE
jgi:hypothetical protein